MTHKILIIEDEQPAVKRLQSLISHHLAPVELLGAIDSVEDSVAFLKTQPEPDLVFMDIQLADGQSFDIFHQVSISCPIIFITAYNDYAIQAFDVNGLDYLLKPIKEERFAKAIQKYLQKNTPQTDYSNIIQQLQTTSYKSRFLVKQGDQFIVIPTDKIAYFQSLDGYTHLFIAGGKKFLLDDSIESITPQLDPSIFFQVNRKTILSISAIHKINSWFNSRLKIELRPRPPEEVIVSRNRVKEFKAFLNQ